jgi:hypothetical protein
MDSLGSAPHDVAMFNFPLSNQAGKAWQEASEPEKEIRQIHATMLFS